MPKKALASLNVVINAVTSPLFKGLAIAQKRMVAFGTKMKTIGRSISMSFTLPFAAIGVAGAKMAIEFEQSMTKINTLVGTSASEVNKLGAEVKAMAVETATPAKDLADALFFIQSAGIKGAESIETLRVSSKAAAMNMGDITDIASATTSIMSAFGKSSDQAGDLLHETLKQGKFEASEFMGKIGQVIPTAAGLGVSFEELGAATATMSKLSGDASGSLTAINSVMMKLGTPGAEQKAILADLNMSYDDLNAMMKDSLMGTLNHLFTSLEGNDEALVRVFSSSKAVKGAFATAGLQAETYADVLDGMNNSMGNVEKGFQTQSQTVGFKMAQSLEKLKQAGMELGAILMPVFSAIVDGAVKLGNAFTSLDTGTKQLILGAGALLAFSGPLMALVGGLITGLGAILSPIGLVIAAIGGLTYVVVKNWGVVKSWITETLNWFVELYNESLLVRVGIDIIVAGFQFLVKVGGIVFETIWKTIKSFASSVINAFKGVGNIIKGALTLDWETFKKGLGQGVDALENGFIDPIKHGLDGIGKVMGAAAEVGIKTFAKVMKREATGSKLSLFTEEGIQGSVDNVGNWLTTKLGAVKNKLKGFMGGTSLLVPEVGGGGEPGGGGGGDDGTGALNKSIAKQKSALQKYLDWSKKGYDDLATKVGEVWGNISQVAGAALSGIGNMFAAEHEKQTTILDNEQTASDERFAKDMERELQAVENSKMSEEAKKEAIKKIEDKYAQKKAQADEKIDAKRKALELKQAKRDKAMKIASAIMGTAQAVVQALAQGGPIAGPILAGLMAGLGAAQIATIASTPLPMASGGIVYGPTNALVGEYAGAKNDPEVVAPLSKLKNMLGNQQQMNVALNVGGVLKGEDIFLANEDTGTNRQRYI